MSFDERSFRFSLLGVRAKLPVLARCCGALLGGIMASLSCAPSGNEGPDTPFGSGAANGGGSAGSRGSFGGSQGHSGSGGKGGMPSIGFPDGAAQPGAEAGCAMTSSRAEQMTKQVPVTTTVEKPIDLYIMFDATLSTACLVVFGQTAMRWDAFKTAMTQFVQLPAAAGVSVGLQYYGLNDSCDRALYAQPAVPIAPLPGNAAAIVNSLNGRTPGGATPLDAALGGAIDHAVSWARSHADHTVAVVLVTDAAGAFPCGTLANVNDVAGAGFNGTPSIPTYVIGTIPGASEPVCFYDVGGAPVEANLHAIAQRGGTGQAIIVQTGADAASQFLAALSKIRQSVTKTVTKTEITYVPVACEWKIPDPPDGGKFDRTKVNFQFSTGGGAPQPIGYVSSAADCSRVQAGWYYDDPAAPTKILVCPQTCSAIQASSTAQVDIILGCETVPATVL